MMSSCSPSGSFCPCIQYEKLKDRINGIEACISLTQQWIAEEEAKRYKKARLLHVENHVDMKEPINRSFSSQNVSHLQHIVNHPKRIEQRKKIHKTIQKRRKKKRIMDCFTNFLEKPEMTCVDGDSDPLRHLHNHLDHELEEEENLEILVTPPSDDELPVQPEWNGSSDIRDNVLLPLHQELTMELTEMSVIYCHVHKGYLAELHEKQNKKEKVIVEKKKAEVVCIFTVEGQRVIWYDGKQKLKINECDVAYSVPAMERWWKCVRRPHTMLQEEMTCVLFASFFNGSIFHSLMTEHSLFMMHIPSMDASFIQHKSLRSGCLDYLDHILGWSLQGRCFNIIEFVDYMAALSPKDDHGAISMMPRILVLSTRWASKGHTHLSDGHLMTKGGLLTLEYLDKLEVMIEKLRVSCNIRPPLFILSDMLRRHMSRQSDVPSAIKCIQLFVGEFAKVRVTPRAWTDAPIVVERVFQKLADWICTAFIDTALMTYDVMDSASFYMISKKDEKGMAKMQPLQCSKLILFSK